jgi:hypothetical protein
LIPRASTFFITFGSGNTTDIDNHLRDIRPELACWYSRSMGRMLHRGCQHLWGHVRQSVWPPCHRNRVKRSRQILH